MYLFASIRKRMAIKRYVQHLGKDLAQRYGKANKYSPSQVVKTIHDCGYNWRHICYAHALYVSQKHFDQWHQELGEECDYDVMREEIAATHIGGSLESMAASDSDASFDVSLGGDSSND